MMMGSVGMYTKVVYGVGSWKYLSKEIQLAVLVFHGAVFI